MNDTTRMLSGKNAARLAAKLLEEGNCVPKADRISPMIIRTGVRVE